CGIVFFSSRRRHTRSDRDWSSDVCSSDLSKRSPGIRSFPCLYCADVLKGQGKLLIPGDRFDFLWVVDFPLLSFDKENNRWYSSRSEERRVGKEGRRGLCR